MRVFALARALLVQLRKEQDIPEVEAAKAIVYPVVRSHWNRRVQEAVDDAIDGIADLRDELPTPSVDAVLDASRDDKKRDDLIAALILSLYLLIERRIAQPFDRRRHAVVKDGVRALLISGGKSLSDGFPFGRVTGATVPATVEAELLLLLRGKLIGHRVEVESLLKEALTNRRLRRELRSPESAEFALRLETILGGARAEDDFVAPTVDQWAYSAFATGAAVAAIEDLTKVLYAWNPLDEKTTRFCRWVHGKPIPIEWVKAKLEQVRMAVVRQDYVALRFARPLVNFTGSSTVADYQAHLRQCVLPSYHFGCRTVLRSRPV